MNLIFAGTPEFAATALRQLLQAGFNVPLVLTQPDRPAGRGLKLHASPVKLLAQEHGIPVAQPPSLRLDGKYADDAIAAQTAIVGANADVMVVAAYGLILPQWVLDLMSGDGPPLAAKAPPGGSAAHAVASVGARKLGCLNIHASLLPRWRGAAPIHRAIEAGDARTGITIMQMDAGLDTGDMLLVDSLAIAPGDTTTTLHDKLAVMGGRCIVQALTDYNSLERKPQPQVTASAPAVGSATAPSSASHAHSADNAASLSTSTAGITYAHKIDKAEARIDWAQPAATLERKIRALDPFPGCTAQVLGEVVKINSSQINSCLSSINGLQGTIVHINEAGIGVQTGDGVLQLTTLQRAGGKRLPAAEFVRGFALQVGQRFE
jgi:methionyl-tRNA formyltransferase